MFLNDIPNAQTIIINNNSFKLIFQSELCKKTLFFKNNILKWQKTIETIKKPYGCDCYNTVYLKTIYKNNIVVAQYEEKYCKYEKRNSLYTKQQMSKTKKIEYHLNTKRITQQINNSRKVVQYKKNEGICENVNFLDNVHHGYQWITSAKAVYFWKRKELN